MKKNNLEAIWKVFHLKKKIHLLGRLWKVALVFYLNMIMGLFRDFSKLMHFVEHLLLLLRLSELVNSLFSSLPHFYENINFNNLLIENLHLMNSLENPQTNFHSPQIELEKLTNTINWNLRRKSLDVSAHLSLLLRDFSSQNIHNVYLLWW